MKNEISLIELWELMKKRAISIIAFALLGAMALSIYTFFIATPQYSSTTQLLVNQTRGEQTSIDINDITTNVLLIDTYKELITGPAILNTVSNELEANLTTDQLSSMIYVDSPQDAQLFNLTVTTSNPNTAAEIANTVALTFQREIGGIMSSVDNVVITYVAEPRLNPISPNHIVNLLIGLLMGVMIGIFKVVIQHVSDDTLRDIEFITDEIGWNDLGSVSEIIPKTIVTDKRNSGIENNRLENV